MLPEVNLPDEPKGPRASRHIFERHGGLQANQRGLDTKVLRVSLTSQSQLLLTYLEEAPDADRSNKREY